MLLNLKTYYILCFTLDNNHNILWSIYSNYLHQLSKHANLRAFLLFFYKSRAISRLTCIQASFHGRLLFYALRLDPSHVGQASASLDDKKYFAV